METKICIKCDKKLEIKYFELRTDTKKLRNICKKCNKGYLEDRFDKQEKIKYLFSIGKKQCSKCNLIKSVDEFSKDRYTVTRLSSNCKLCKNTTLTSEQRREFRLKKEYNLTIEEYNKFYNEQDGKCLICSKSVIKLDVDHNHSTGKVRGLLCFHCNAGLGHYKDNKDLLLKSIYYLENNLETREIT